MPIWQLLAQSHLAEAVLEGQRLYPQLLHPLQLLLVEVLQLVHGEEAVAVEVHAAEPVEDCNLWFCGKNKALEYKYVLN